MARAGIFLLINYVNVMFMSIRYIAQKLKAELGSSAIIEGQGISLSPVQVQRAKEVLLPKIKLSFENGQ